MYYEHFGLTQAPFKITPNTDFFFGGVLKGQELITSVRVRNLISTQDGV